MDPEGMEKACTKKDPDDQGQDQGDEQGLAVLPPERLLRGTGTASAYLEVMDSIVEIFPGTGGDGQPVPWARS